jgi:hypothetical protein
MVGFDWLVQRGRAVRQNLIRTGVEADVPVLSESPPLHQKGWLDRNVRARSGFVSMGELGMQTDQRRAGCRIPVLDLEEDGTTLSTFSPHRSGNCGRGVGRLVGR